MLLQSLKKPTGYWTKARKMGRMITLLLLGPCIFFSWQKQRRLLKSAWADHQGSLLGFASFSSSLLDMSSENDHTLPRHDPRRFSHNVELNVKRGLNIINILSGQHVARWIFNGAKHPHLNPKEVTWMRCDPAKFLSEKDDAANSKPMIPSLSTM